MVRVAPCVNEVWAAVTSFFAFQSYMYGVWGDANAVVCTVPLLFLRSPLDLGAPLLALWSVVSPVAREARLAPALILYSEIPVIVRRSPVLHRLAHAVFRVVLLGSFVEQMVIPQEDHTWEDAVFLKGTVLLWWTYVVRHVHHMLRAV